jgi:hypothetical protein
MVFDIMELGLGRRVSTANVGPELQETPVGFAPTAGPIAAMVKVSDIPPRKANSDFGLPS